MSRFVRLLAAFAVAAGVMLLLAPQASAHAVMLGSTPADGARLQKVPASVTISFDEPVGLTPGYLRVVDTAGRRVDTGNPTHPGGDGSKITVAIKSGQGDGTYIVSFRIISADSHPVAGSVRFVVGNGALGVGGGSSGSTEVNQAVSTALATSHWLSFAGIGLVGGSWLVFSLWPAGQRRLAVRRVIWGGWTLAVLGAIGEFLLQGPYGAGTGLSTALHGDLLDATLHANTGQLLSLRLVLLGILAGVLTATLWPYQGRPDESARPSWGPEAAAIVGVGVVITFAASGHAQSANPRWLAVLVDALHLTAMIVWLGGLVILLVAAFSHRRGRSGGDGAQDEPADPTADPTVELAGGSADSTDELAAGLPIFSRVAMAAVATLAVTGTIQAWREIGALDAITQTWYGRLVLIKVGLFLTLLVLGYGARGIVLRASRSRSVLTRLRRTLITEVTVGAAVLVATGILIAQPPGQVALAAQRSKPQTTTVAVTNTAKAVVEVTPGKHGSVEVAVQLTGAIKPTDVTATASLPAKGLGPIPVKLQAAGPATYSATDVLLPSAGDWLISVTVQTSQFDSTTAVAKIHLY